MAEKQQEDVSDSEKCLTELSTFDSDSRTSPTEMEDVGQDIEDECKMEDSETPNDSTSSHDGGSPVKKSGKAGGKTKKNKMKQKKAIPGTSTYQANPAGSYKATSSGSLLDEVLNEKKMVLLRSPEVIKFLQNLQNDVKEKKISEAPEGAARLKSRYQRDRNPPFPDTTEIHHIEMETKTEEPENEHSHGVLKRLDSGGIKKEVHFDLPSVSSPMDASNQCELSTIDKTVLSSGNGEGTNSSTVIWSKDASAFSSVGGNQNDNG